jgi:homoserine dehydrogenase
LTHLVCARRSAVSGTNLTWIKLGDITLIAPGAGRTDTGYAIIGDILSFGHKLKP